MQQLPPSALIPSLVLALVTMTIACELKSPPPPSGDHRPREAAFTAVKVPLGKRHDELSRKLHEAWVKNQWNSDSDGRTYRNWKGKVDIYDLQAGCKGRHLYAVSMGAFNVQYGREEINLGGGWTGSAGTHIAVLAEEHRGFKVLFFEPLIDLLGVQRNSKGSDCPPLQVVLWGDHGDEPQWLRYDSKASIYRAGKSTLGTE